MTQQLPTGWPPTARLSAAGRQPVESDPYWAATGAVTYRDPDGRELVFAPFIFAVNEPAESDASGQHWAVSGCWRHVAR